MSRAMGRNREDIETGFTELLSDRRTTLSYLISVVALILVILNAHILFSSDMIGVTLGISLMAVYLIWNANCQQSPTEAEAHDHLVPDNEQDIEEQRFAPRTREQLPALRIQLALTDRDFDDLDYENLRALDEDITLDASSPSEGDSNARFMVQAHVHTQEMQKNELTCIICLELFSVGELIRSLPCLHQFHAGCVDPWLREHGTCPTCKYRVGPGRQESGIGDVERN